MSFLFSFTSVRLKDKKAEAIIQFRQIFFSLLGDFIFILLRGRDNYRNQPLEIVKKYITLTEPVVPHIAFDEN